MAKLSEENSGEKEKEENYKDLLSVFFSATYYQPFASHGDRLAAEKILQGGFDMYDLQTFFLETRILQRQPESLELPFSEMISKFGWLLDVSTLADSGF